jgi:hypothetical protein
VVTPQVQAEALRLWERFCGPRSEGGNDGGVSVYCKVATEDLRDVQQHTLNIPSRQAGQQVVFVQPPSVHTKHDVVVTGGGGAAPKTVIYVKPAKNTNEVNILDRTQRDSAPQKPSLYFLKGDHGGDSQADGRFSPIRSGEVIQNPRNGQFPPLGSAGVIQDPRDGRFLPVGSSRVFQDPRDDQFLPLRSAGIIQEPRDGRFSPLESDVVIQDPRGHDRFLRNGNSGFSGSFRSGGRISRQITYVPRARGRLQ